MHPRRSPLAACSLVVALGLGGALIPAPASAVAAPLADVEELAACRHEPAHHGLVGAGSR